MENKTVIIIGASSGMGFALAKLLYSKGANLIMVSRNENRLQKAASAISVDGKRVMTIAADITIAQDRERIANSVETLDHLVITAADLAYMPVSDFTEEAALKAVQSKILGPFFLTQKVVKKLPPQGSITFVSGIAAERPVAGGTMTGTVNGAINAMVRGLALEFAPIRVNAVSPGWTDTPFWQKIATEEKKAEAFKTMSAKMPVRRIGKPEDIAEAIAFAMNNGFISGSVLYVDGGQRLV